MSIHVTDFGRNLTKKEIHFILDFVARDRYVRQRVLAMLEVHRRFGTAPDYKAVIEERKAKMGDKEKLTMEITCACGKGTIDNNYWMFDDPDEKEKK